MRNSFKILVVTAMALGAVALAAVPGGAGVAPTNTVIIEKHVTGVVPAGTTFTVAVTCENILSAGAAAPIPDQVVTFDATGMHTSDNSLTTPAGTQCTAEETVNGGATSTTYACDMVRGVNDQEGPPFQGNCDEGGASATFGEVGGDTATITVTNNFPTPTPIAPPVVQAIQATPTFTG